MENSYVLQMKNRKFSDFYLCFCGYAKCAPFHSYGPAVRPNYILHYVLEGRGRFSVGEEEYELHAGQGFLIEPEVQTYYEADREEPWSYLWIGFAGERAEEYLRDLGLNKKQLIYQCACGEELEKIVRLMLQKSTYTTANEYMLQGLLCQFFSVLAEHMEIEADRREKEDNLYIRKAVEYIQNHYSYPVQVQQIADYVGVTRSYLYTLFKKNLQFSPKEYLTNFRITRASQLLEITGLSVESVARSCGYQDTLGFSKAFKAKMGVTPLSYRKQKEEWQRNLRRRKPDLS